MKKEADAFGQSLWDALREGEAWHVIEREDGYVEPCNAAVYLRTVEQWAPHERTAMERVRGRVLDVGCGAGRHALELQKRGLDVVAIDQSPLAVKTTRARGVKQARVVAIEDVTPRLGRFDTLLLMGNNFGLFGSRAKARRLLQKFWRMMPAGAVIVAESNDVYKTSNRVHLGYQRWNRRRGRMSGQIRMRARYHQMKTTWFDYLMVSVAEMKALAAGTGWELREVIPSKGSTYVAVLARRDQV